MTRAVRDPIAETLGGISPGALPLTAPTVERHGDEFTIRWAEHSVDLVFTGIRESSGGLHAELSIQRDGEEVHWSRLGLASSRSRDGIVKLLERSPAAFNGAPVPWMTMVDRAARVVADAVRRGEPARPLRPRPITGRRFLVDPLLPLAQPTILYADGGSGKSTLALLVAVAVATGAKVPGLDVAQPCSVMFADYESSEPVVAEVVCLLERGLGVSCGDRLLYRRMFRPLMIEAPALRVEIARSGVGLFILDSTGPAAHDDPAGAGAALATMTSLRSLGEVTTLALAHVSAAGADQRVARPYGSVYYSNEARMTWELRRAEEEPDDLVVALFNQKMNAGRKHPPLAFRFTFTPDTIRVSTSPLADSPDLMNRTTVRQRLRTMLATGALTAEELAEATGEGEATIRKTLARMVKAEEAVQLPGTPLRWGRRA